MKLPEVDDFPREKPLRRRYKYDFANVYNANMTAHRLALGAFVFFACTTLRAQAPLKLHVPSPDWRDQVIYFVMTDRFADGDTTNNDQGAGVFKAGDGGKYQGGDLRGLAQRLDYVQGLGATAVWITPPVANQWFDPVINYTGYHGYWASDFKRVDPHVGTLDDYKQLSHALHSRGMYLVQDIVVNHTANFFDYDDRWRRGDAVTGYQPNPGSKPVTKPTQAPFDLNDPRDPAQRAANIYHWTPGVKNYKNTQEVFDHQMSRLDDLNTENPAVRRALRDSYGYWIREVGVDAYRVDTAFYVPPAYFRDFLYSRDAAAPGMMHVAQATGRKQFHVFGEGFGVDKFGEEKLARQIESYTRDARGPLMPSMINFTLYGAMNDVFAQGKPPNALGDRITRMLRTHRAPHLMPTFIDNHDVDRFLSAGSEAAFKQALFAMFTLPGIPTIYYGSEQGFTLRRASMFASGYGADGRDRYDTNAPLYQLIASLAQLRKDERVLSRGTARVLYANGARVGAVVWRMQGADGDLLVAINTAEHATFADGIALGGHNAHALTPRFSLVGDAPRLQVNAKDTLSFEMPARSAWVWKIEKTSKNALFVPTPQIKLANLRSKTHQNDLKLSGKANANAVLQVIVDGDVSQAQTTQTDARGQFSATIDTRAMSDASVTHRAIVRDVQTGASAGTNFRVALPWQLATSVTDPAGDDHGADGKTQYPTDASYAPRHMDIRAVRARVAGTALRIEIDVPAISKIWNPTNGFDHVAFTTYIELPGVDTQGAGVMPLQNATLPEGMRWHRRLRVHGWSNALHAPAGATADNEGTPVSPGAAIAVNEKTKTIAFTLSSEALGHPRTLDGAKIYVTTWDYDNGYRAIDAAPTPFTFGGISPDGAKVMDSSGVIVLDTRKR
jgi:glycosidase